MDLIDLADEELPAARATIEQAKEAAVTARNELDQHQQWLEHHQDLYSEAVKGCERRLRRQAFIAACRDKARLPIQLLTTAWSGFFNAGRRRSLRTNLKDRLQELDLPSGVKAGQQLQERIQAMDGRDLR
jgi:hypothetical protein